MKGGRIIVIQRQDYWGNPSKSYYATVITHNYRKVSVGLGGIDIERLARETEAVCGIKGAPILEAEEVPDYAD